MQLAGEDKGSKKDDLKSHRIKAHSQTHRVGAAHGSGNPPLHNSQLYNFRMESEQTLRHSLLSSPQERLQAGTLLPRSTIVNSPALRSIARQTLMENRLPLGSYRYFPVLVIWGSADVKGEMQSKDRDRERAWVRRGGSMVETEMKRSGNVTTNLAEQCNLAIVLDQTTDKLSSRGNSRTSTCIAYCTLEHYSQALATHKLASASRPHPKPYPKNPLHHPTISPAPPERRNVHPSPPCRSQSA